MMRIGSILLGVCLVGASASTHPAKDTHVVFIVRHAEKTSTPADDPPLTAEGQERAHILARMCRTVGLTAIFTSEFRRTQQTAEPLARELGITPNVITALDVKALTSAIKARAGGNSLVVAHSNTIPLIIQGLGAGTIEPIAETEFDNLFVVIVPIRSPAKVLRLKYGNSVPVPTAKPVGEWVFASWYRTSHEGFGVGWRVQAQDADAGGHLTNVRDPVFAKRKEAFPAAARAVIGTSHRIKPEVT